VKQALLISYATAKSTARIRKTGILFTKTPEIFGTNISHNRLMLKCRPGSPPPIKMPEHRRQERRKSSNSRQAAPCSVNTVLSICNAGTWRVSAQGEASMMSYFFRSVALAGALASAGIAASPGTAVARTNYDGIWSVLIITQSGPCERAYRYGVQISNGRVLGGDGSANLQGQVANNGAVRVSVSAGDQRAAGSGRLSRDRGSGLWRGQGPTGTCAGRWQAERRG
jgi:hypothetical protein